MICHAIDNNGAGNDGFLLPRRVDTIEGFAQFDSRFLAVVNRHGQFSGHIEG